MSDGANSWYWCLHHGRAEAAGDQCRAADRLGPYPTREAAGNWREKVEARNDEWDAQDAAWRGEDAEDAKDAKEGDDR